MDQGADQILSNLEHNLKKEMGMACAGHVNVPKK